MKNRIHSLIRRFHHSLPPGIRRFYRFGLVIARKLGGYMMPVYHSCCRNSAYTEEVCFVQIGWDKKLLRYWLDRFDGEHGEIVRRRWITVWGIQRYLSKNKSEFDLAIIDSSKKPVSRNFIYGFQLPRWVEMVLDIERVTRKKKFHNIRRNIRKNNLGIEVRNSMEDFDLFYFKMYAPFLSRRHGARADVADYKHFASKFRNETAKLFFIILNGQPVAAAYVEEKGDISRLSAVGVLDGNPDIYRMGVIGGLYYHVILHYRDRGMNSMLLGKSMPGVFDGVTEYKREFGATPFLKDLRNQRRFHLVALNSKGAVNQFMKSNPVFYLEEDHLNIAGFVDINDFPDYTEFLRYFKRLYPEQVEVTVLYCTGDRQKLEHWLQEGGYGNVVVKDISEAFPPLF